jgi:hypothetical protein
MMTLDQFILTHMEQKPSRWSGWPRNAYVRAAGFSALYVRMGPRVLAGVTHPLVLDIANVVANKPGNGAFTCLVEALHQRGITLYVENVLNARFAKMLPRLGFTQVDSTSRIDPSLCPSFYLIAPQCNSTTNMV